METFLPTKRIENGPANLTQWTLNSLDNYLDTVSELFGDVIRPSLQALLLEMVSEIIEIALNDERVVGYISVDDENTPTICISIPLTDTEDEAVIFQTSFTEIADVYKNSDGSRGPEAKILAVHLRRIADILDPP